MNEDYLQHHGVKGTRWGVIRTTRERHGLKKQMRAANKEARKRYDKDFQKYKAEKKQNKLNYIRKAYNPKQVTFGRKVFDNMVQGSLLASYKYSTAAYPEASRKKRLGYSFVFGTLAGDVIR